MPVIVAALLVVSCRVGIGGGPGLTDLAELPKATGDLRRVALAVLVMNAVLHAVTRSVNTLGFWGSAYPLPQGVDASFVLVCVLLAGMAYLALVRVGGADLLTRYIPAFLMLLGGFFFLDERVIEALRMPDWLNGALSTWVELYAHTLYWVIGVHCVRSLDMHPLRSLGIAVLAMNVASIVVSLYLQWLTQVSGVVVMTVAYLFTALMVLVARGTKGGESMGLSDESLAEATHRSLEEIAMGAGLTSRETEVFILLSQGRDRSYIRDELFISEATIKTHCRHIYAKLGVANKQELISFVSGRSNR